MEVKECIFGEVNVITKEIFCNKHNEFCKFIDTCKIKIHHEFLNGETNRLRGTSSRIKP